MPLRGRLKWALGAYSVIGVAAAFTLDGPLLYTVLILLVALAVRSWIAVRRESLEAPPPSAPPDPR